MNQTKKQLSITVLGDVSHMSNTLNEFKHIFYSPTPHLVKEWEKFIKLKKSFQIVE